jgi:hypothetical protein
MQYCPIGQSPSALHSAQNPPGPVQIRFGKVAQSVFMEHGGEQSCVARLQTEFTPPQSWFEVHATQC